MTDVGVVTICFLAGIVLLMIEIFVPAYGMIGAIGVGVLGYGLYRLFLISETAGFIGVIILAIALPTALVITVKNWHRTPAGRYISSPNPLLAESDRMPTSQLAALVGQTGRAMTMLRPVGTCQFENQRVECKAEYGIISKGTEVLAIRLVDRTVLVRPVASESSATSEQSIAQT